MVYLGGGGGVLTFPVAISYSTFELVFLCEN